MRLTLEQDRLVRMLKESITLMCKSALSYDSELSIEGLLGITLDRQNVVLVNINQSFQSEIADTSQQHKSSSRGTQGKEAHGDASTDEDSRHSTDGRRRRKRRRSRESLAGNSVYLAFSQQCL